MTAQPSTSGDWINAGKKPGDAGQEPEDDWEAAFQAEDFVFSPGGGEENELFASSPDAPATNPYEFTPPDESDLQGLPDLDHGPGGAALPGFAAPGDDDSAPLAEDPFLLRLQRAARRLTARFAGLPLVHRAALVGIALLCLLILGLVFFPGDRLELQGELGADAPAAVSGSPPSSLLPETSVENIRQKWHFEPFFLPVQPGDTEGRPLFLSVDLSLLLVLAPGDELPEAQKIFLRDLIYRYFQEQPPASLRRFVLARAEMNRSLLDWLRRQSPTIPIETVIFNRYELI